MRWRAVGVAAALLVPAALPPAASGAEKVLSYSIREARAYAFRVPLRKEVITLAQRARPCDPEEDPYRCDDSQYEHRPNCPPNAAIGPATKGPAAAEPEGDAKRSGGAGDGSGPQTSPSLESPVTLNDLVTLGRIGHVGALRDASGFASESYVDLSGRQEPQAHTESDAFSGSRRAYEERCFGEVSEGSYVHVLSRSTQGPSTYHLAECFERGCRFGGPGLGGAEEGRTIVHLAQRADTVVARTSALLERATWADGGFTVDSVRSAIELESDGTADGLRWSVSSSVLGARLGGRPIELAPGQTVSVPGIQIGLAEPWVQTSENGGRIRIVAPGLYFSTQEQSAFFGGTELTATIGRRPPLAPEDDDDDAGDTTTGGSGFDTDLDTTGPVPIPTSAATPVTPAVPEAPPIASEPAVTVEQVRTGQGALVSLLALAMLAVLLILLRWIGRYSWGRRLYRVQPLRTFDWLYRAFVKT